jgi:hypothetical protein
LAWVIEKAANGKLKIIDELGKVFDEIMAPFAKSAEQHDRLTLANFYD